MASKAKLFDDQEAMVQIMREKDPVKQKQLGEKREKLNGELLRKNWLFQD